MTIIDGNYSRAEFGPCGRRKSRQAVVILFRDVGRPSTFSPTLLRDVEMRVDDLIFETFILIRTNNVGSMRVPSRSVDRVIGNMKVLSVPCVIGLRTKKGSAGVKLKLKKKKKLKLA